MAIPENTTWEVRPGAGSSANGGAFVPGSTGTDYSQQNSAQFTGTDLASLTFSVVSSASHSFVSTDVGNIIKVSGGTGLTAGYYQIVSVSAGLATLDRDTGTGSGGTWALGGAFDTMATAISAITASNIVYLKGTYTATAVQVINIDSGFHSPFVVNGYSVARDDGSKATWTTATNSINLIDCSSMVNATFKNIIFSNTAATKGTGATAGNCFIPVTANGAAVLFANCVFDGFTVAINLDWQNVANTMLNAQFDTCEFKNMVSHCIVTTSSVGIGGCYFHNNGGDGLRCGIPASNAFALSGPSTVAFSVFYANGGNGITNASTAGPVGQVQSMLVLINNAFTGNTGAGVVAPSNNTGSTMAWNNIFYGNGTYGYESVSSGAPPLCIPRGNAFGSNGTADRLNFPVGPSDVTLTANPFTNSSGGDFSLNSTTGGGAACKAAGYQSTII